jgi:hypothetical protein
MPKRGPKPVDRNALEMLYGAWLGVLDGMRNGRYVRSDLDFKPETDLWRQLLEATNSEEVRTVCDQSEFWLNPKRGAIIFYRTLSEHADSFVAAKKDPRWPRSDRPTNQGKRNRFLARALAGIAMGISVRTAQDLLAKTDKEKLEKIYHPVCDCGHRERDHLDRSRCKYCVCSHYRYSGVGIRRGTSKAIGSRHLLGDAAPIFGLAAAQSGNLFWSHKNEKERRKL